MAATPLIIIRFKKYIYVNESEWYDALSGGCLRKKKSYLFHYVMLCKLGHVTFPKIDILSGASFWQSSHEYITQIDRTSNFRMMTKKSAKCWFSHAACHMAEH